MKLLLIARPSAHRNEVSIFLEKRGAEVEVRSHADPSALRDSGAVDAIVVLEDGGKDAEPLRRWRPDVPVIRWPRDNGSAPGAGSDISPAPTLPSGTLAARSFLDLQELAFRVAQAAHGTHGTHGTGADAA